MPRRKKTPGTALVPSTSPRSYPVAGTTIQLTQLHIVPNRHPAGRGPWTDGPDKLAWTDQATGLACTILRDDDGTLGGYVGLGPNHPLFGFSHDAIPGTFGIGVHGGLDYGKACDGGPEATSVCHPEQTGADPLWWFGFTCNRNTDLVPGKPVREQGIGAENGRTYKTVGYVYGETVKLAAQLKAADGKEGGASGVPLNLSPSQPVGLDPGQKR